jgi:hypothetical protein
MLTHEIVGPAGGAEVMLEKEDTVEEGTRILDEALDVDTSMLALELTLTGGPTGVEPSGHDPPAGAVVVSERLSIMTVNAASVLHISQSICNDTPLN